MLHAGGYEDAHAPEYEKFRLRVRGQGLYRVSEGFPRLVPTSLKNGLPVGVSNLTYELRLDAAGSWLLSTSPEAAAKLLGDLASKGAAAH